MHILNYAWFGIKTIIEGFFQLSKYWKDVVWVIRVIWGWDEYLWFGCQQLTQSQSNEKQKISISKWSNDKQTSFLNPKCFFDRVLKFDFKVYYLLLLRNLLVSNCSQFTLFTHSLGQGFLLLFSQMIINWSWDNNLPKRNN